MNNIARNHNVICIHQRPRSPKSNMLDRTVDAAWTDLEQVKLENIWNPWRLVLGLIIDDGDGNRLVESKRGKLFRAPSDEAEIIEDMLDEEETELDLLKEAEIDVNY